MAQCKRVVVVGILFLAVALTPVGAVSGPLEDGVAAYDSGDSAASLETKAWKLRKLLAEQDDADSQYILGNMYISCNGIRPRGQERRRAGARLSRAERGRGGGDPPAVTDGTQPTLFWNELCL